MSIVLGSMMLGIGVFMTIGIIVINREEKRKTGKYFFETHKPMAMLQSGIASFGLISGVVVLS